MEEILAEMIVELHANLRPMIRQMQGARREVHSQGTMLGRTAGMAFSIGFKAALIGAGATIAGAFATAMGSIFAASGAEEMENRLKVAFGDSVDDLKSRLDEFAVAAKRGKGEMKDMASQFGALLSPMKMGEKKVTDMSVELSKLAVDLSSFYDRSEAETSRAIFSGLVGETEPLRRLGINLSAARMQEEALKEGLIKTKRVLTAQERALMAYKIMLEDSSKAQGDAIRTQGSFSNSFRGMIGQIKDFMVQLGNMFLPMATKVVNIFRDWMGVLIQQEATFKQWGALLAEIFGNVLRGFEGLWQRVGPGVVSFGEQAKATFTSILEGLAIFTSNWDVFWEIIKKSVRLAWIDIKDFSLAGLNAIGTFLISLGKQAMSIFKLIFQNLVDQHAVLTEAIKTAMIGGDADKVISTAFDRIAKEFEMAADIAKKAGSEANEAFWDTFNNSDNKIERSKLKGDIGDLFRQAGMDRDANAPKAVAAPANRKQFEAAGIDGFIDGAIGAVMGISRSVVGGLKASTAQAAIALKVPKKLEQAVDNEQKQQTFTGIAELSRRMQMGIGSGDKEAQQRKAMADGIKMQNKIGDMANKTLDKILSAVAKGTPYALFAP